MTTSEERPRLAPAWGILLAVAGVKLVVHLALANRYGVFRDELYFLAIAGLFTMNIFEPLFWTGCAYVLVRLADGASPGSAS